MPLEERNDVLRQVFMPSYPVCHSIAVVLPNNTAIEIALQGMEDLNIAFVLDDRELRKDLSTGGHLRMSIHAHMETTFAIHESDNPLRIELQRELLNIKSLRILGSSPSLSCGLSPCPSDFYDPLEADTYRTAVRGVSRIWFSFTKASESLTLGPL